MPNTEQNMLAFLASNNVSMLKLLLFEESATKKNPATIKEI